MPLTEAPFSICCNKFDECKKLNRDNCHECDASDKIEAVIKFLDKEDQLSFSCERGPIG